MHDPASPGFVTGGVRTVLRLEGLALLAAGVVLFAVSGGSWWLFAVLFLAPDLSFFGYLAGPRAGAFAYNVLHSTFGPVLLALAARYVFASDLLLDVAFIWLAHIGFDRAIGYGLKYASAFGDTHLGRIGKEAAPGQ